METHQHSFITNQGKFLSEIINGILPKSNSVDILVGYFYYSGFQEISSSLVDKKLRILVGLEVDTLISNTVREIDSFVQGKKSRGQIKDDYFKSLIDLFNMTDYFDSEKKIEAFKLFYSKIKDGTLEIKKTEEPCHAKLYIFDYNDSVNEEGETPGSVITGSSNLSYSGLKDRIEINTRFDSKQHHIDAKKIFDELWKNAISIVNKDNLEEFDTKVIKHIWLEKLYAPYLMYIRVLNEYFAIPEFKGLLSPYDITNGKFYNLKYQTDAVRMALNSINNHNGVIVADVVGLGKSIIASAVARNLNLKTIVITPPHLTTQWNEYKDEFGFTATVFSNGKIEEAFKHFNNLSREGEHFLIIIDEAHKYRNEFTKDYANLHKLCCDNKVMLLTATPFNNRPEDIFSMLKLFQIPSKSSLKTVDNLGAEFKQLISEYKKLSDEQRNGNSEPSEIAKEAKRIADTIRSIISPIVVRRSRLDLEEIPDYKKDLEQQGIETIIPNSPKLLDYDLGDLNDLYLDTLNKIDRRDNEESYSFKAARYAVTTYIKSELRDELQKKLLDKYDIELNLLVGRQANISAFMRKLLVRRFESSIDSFRTSLKYMIDSSNKMLDWIEKTKKIPIYKKADLPEVEDLHSKDDDELVEIKEVFEKFEAKGFFVIELKYIDDNFIKDIKSDIELLKNIYNEWFNDDKLKYIDPKLESFAKILKNKLEKEPNRKIIVFTEFADTANYLGLTLKSKFSRLLKFTSADASSHNKEIIRANFDAGLKKELQHNDYDILIATDAISEGYNLHRAGAIFNYDIPYNPTRVIQRIGRINRINKKVFKDLHIYNYFPSDVGEIETRTKQISSLKMAMIHAIMGEDTKALTSDEQLQSFFKKQYDEEFAKDETASWDNKYRVLLDQLKGTEIYKQAINIPFRSRTARKHNGNRKGVVLFGKKSNDYTFKFAYSKEDTAISLTAEEAIKLFEADKEEKAFETSETFEGIYQNLKEQLFTSKRPIKNDKEKLKAMEKIKYIAKNDYPNKDYLKDLMKAIELDALSGFEIRFINQLSQKNWDNLEKTIEQSYIDRIIDRIRDIDEGKETLILAEEFLSEA